MSVTMKKIATTKKDHEEGCHSEEEELGHGFVSYHLQPVVDTLRTFVVPSEWFIWSLSNLLLGMKSWVSVARFLILAFCGPPDNLLFDSWDRSDRTC